MQIPSEVSLAALELNIKLHAERCRFDMARKGLISMPGQFRAVPVGPVRVGRGARVWGALMTGHALLKGEVYALSIRLSGGKVTEIVLS